MKRRSLLKKLLGGAAAVVLPADVAAKLAPKTTDTILTGRPEFMASYTQVTGEIVIHPSPHSHNLTDIMQRTIASRSDYMAKQLEQDSVLLRNFKQKKTPVG